MKFADIKDLSLVELRKKKTALSQGLFETRIKNSIGQLPKPSEVRQLRRDIARLNTAITQKSVR